MNESLSKKYDLEDRTKAFAKRVRIFVKKLPRTPGNTEDIPQMIRSSGSAAANYIEANESLGKKDFLMRIRICLKESKETAFWLDVSDIHHDAIDLKKEQAELLNEAQQLVRIFSTILRNSQRNSTH